MYYMHTHYMHHKIHVLYWNMHTHYIHHKIMYYMHTHKIHVLYWNRQTHLYTSSNTCTICTHIIKYMYYMHTHYIHDVYNVCAYSTCIL